MADNVLRASDLTVLVGIVASLEGYLRLDVGDPTGRAHALKHLARRAVDDLTRETRRLAPADPDLTAEVHAIGLRLHAQLAELTHD
jgi:hypothetical protein